LQYASHLRALDPFVVSYWPTAWPPPRRTQPADIAEKPPVRQKHIRISPAIASGFEASAANGGFLLYTVITTGTERQFTSRQTGHRFQTTMTDYQAAGLGGKAVVRETDRRMTGNGRHRRSGQLSWL